MIDWLYDRVVYQIYPRSFFDTNGDGIGDLPGIIEQLEYLKRLGIGVIWLSPIYQSPNRDFGYDASDYLAINPEYGTMADFKRLVKRSQDLDIKLIMDLVINHTSDQHRWFKAARIGDPAFRDYYIWQPPKIGRHGKSSPPNNWTSFFGGSAWSLDEASGDYYLHLFSPHQPDLNFRNPKVVEEMEKIMRFWLDLGIDGFRCDVVNLIYKNSYANGRRRREGIGQEHYVATDNARQLLQQFRRRIWEPVGAVAIGEFPNAGLSVAQQFAKGDGLDALITFDHLFRDSKFLPDKLKERIIDWQQGLPWNVVYWESHDLHRFLNKMQTPDALRTQAATMVATLLLTLRGTPFIYQGQEIGATDVNFASIDQVRDVAALTKYQTLVRQHVPARLAFRLALAKCRDFSRSPMQWNSRKNAGFSDGTPWLPVNPDYHQVNIADQVGDQNSIWHYYKELIELRGQRSALRRGSIRFLPSPGRVLAYEREDADSLFRIIVNLSGKLVRYKFDSSGAIEASNYRTMDYSNTSSLEPYESIVIRQTRPQ